MPARVLDNPIVVAVLGLLLERPAHPYQIFAELRSRSEHYAAVVNRGTLYNVVSAIADAGWAVPEGQQRNGNRPEHTVYALTPEGTAELVRRLDAAIRNPGREFSAFLGAVSYLGALGPEGAVAALTERAAKLRERADIDAGKLRECHADGVPRLFVIEAEYALAQAHSEIAWVESVVAEIRSGTLAWPATQPRK
ncbi:PadR family transcriptional regulator [Nocardia arthritidis]|uniref:PadR family transcriptional regulator n=1 Tax=Nocardia arthritidis TaxID=228602 RepID=A0A6G9YDX7_9NOCA|nr:PadR family transcriptional regulator [Nocardia arthritidis]QIS11431.1 PadR family transcriptional regulator [Nocardia arthritidis]